MEQARGSWSAYLTIIFGFFQAIGITAGFQTLSSMGLVKNPSISTYITLGIILTGGTMLLTWMGEQITDKGLGNGVSLLIFSGIIARLPSGLQELYRDNVQVYSGDHVCHMGTASELQDSDSIYPACHQRRQQQLLAFKGQRGRRYSSYLCEFLHRNSANNSDGFSKES